MPNIREAEVLQVDEWDYPIAVSYDPGAFGVDTLRTVLNNQIASSNPIEIHCYVKGDYEIGGVFKTIEAEEFVAAFNAIPEEKEVFVEKSLALMKGIETYDIIFSEPLKRK